MKRISAGLCAAMLWYSAVPVFAADSTAALPAIPPLPQQTQIINLNLVNALIAIDGQDLAGVFSFVPETAAPAALADYLLRNQSALKRFVKKGKKDLKEVGGINEWDQQVYLYMVSILTAGFLPGDLQKLSKKWMNDISALSLAPAMPLSDMTEKRKKLNP